MWYMYILQNDNHIRLVNTSITSHNDLFLVRTFKIYSLSNFQTYNRVFLTIVQFNIKLVTSLKKSFDEENPSELFASCNPKDLVILCIFNWFSIVYGPTEEVIDQISTTAHINDWQTREQQPEHPAAPGREGREDGERAGVRVAYGFSNKLSQT